MNEIRHNYPDVKKAYDAIVDLERERHEGKTTTLVKKFPSLTTLQGPISVGAFTWNAPVIKHRWLKGEHAHSLEDVIVSPADIARSYLHYKYPKRDMRVNRHQWGKISDMRRFPPLYANPMALHSAVYIDIRSAYWSIMQCVGWDVDYSPGAFVGVRSDVRDFPTPEIKLSRNSLVTIGLPGRMSVWHEGKLHTREKYNKLMNTVLWAFVQDVLHGVASEMVRAGAVYVHTDGYILDAKHAPLGYEIIESWGLPAGTKYQGTAIVYGTGDYEFAGEKPRRKHGVRMRSYSNLQPVKPHWLKARVKRWSDVRRVLLDE